MQENAEKPKTKSEGFQRFVDWAVMKVKADTSCRAALQLADNPATKHHAYHVLIPWIIENEERMDWFDAYALVGAAISRTKPMSNGTLTLGGALWSSNPDEEAASIRRFRRLFAATTSREAIRLLRPILAFLSARGVPLDYAKLLHELCYFNDSVKERWAIDFYRSPTKEKAKEKTT